MREILPLMGVIFNRVASPRHLELLSGAVQAHCRTPVLGSLSRNEDFCIPERHLGLMMGSETPLSAAQLDALALAVAENIDLAAIKRLATVPCPATSLRATPWTEFIPVPKQRGLEIIPAREIRDQRDGVAQGAATRSATVSDRRVPQMREIGLRAIAHLCEQADDTPQGGINSADAVPGDRLPRIGVARDQSFCFYYQDNLDLLAAMGAELVEFSPLTDAKLPPQLSGLYLGGGYPELYGKDLAANHTMLAEIKAWSEEGRPIYAECGGFIYLCQGVVDQSGEFWPLAGVFPCRATMGKRLARLGYREATITDPCLFGDSGQLFGHEFHYSDIVEMPASVMRVYRLQDGRQEGYQIKNTLGGYLHLHFGRTPKVAGHFIDLCRQTPLRLRSGSDSRHRSLSGAEGDGKQA